MKFINILVLATAASALVMPRHHAGQKASGNNVAAANAPPAGANANAANANAAPAAKAAKAPKAPKANAAPANNNAKRHHAGKKAKGAKANEAAKAAGEKRHHAGKKAKGAKANAAAKAAGDKRHHAGQKASGTKAKGAKAAAAKAAAAASDSYEVEILRLTEAHNDSRVADLVLDRHLGMFIGNYRLFRSHWTVDPSTGNYSSFIRSPTGLPTDPALTSHGVDQANQLATHLLELNPPIEQVYSSPYYRCMQTIQPFVRSPKLLQTQSLGTVSGEAQRTRVDLGLSEWYGLAHFDHPSSAPLNELQNFFPELDPSYASSLAPSRRGETLPQLHGRVAKAADFIIRRSDQEGHKAVVLSTHAAVVIALGRVLTGQMETDFGAFTCGLSKFRRRGFSANEASPNSGSETVIEATVPAARGERQIGIEARSGKAQSEIDPASNVDHYPHDSPRSNQESLARGGPGIYGGWICELDSDCSFLRHGEERGWKFSGDESFIETDENGLWLSNITPSSSDTAVDRTGSDSHDSHIDPVVGTPKL
ncbi:histidine phosphatase superfamily [Annulohypoxylon bovei var. microspora]|nr:histidine phosphatase superfamily [Annulohypoxylon bovei var. microspora]